MSLCYELTFLLHRIVSFSFTQGVCVCFVFSPIVSRLLMEKEPMKKPFIFIFNFYFLLLEDNYFTILWWSLKKQKHHFADKDPYSRSYSFSSRHVWMWELDHKEGWALKNWCFQLWCWRRLLRVPWTARRSNQSILKEINPEYWSTVAKAEAPILWPPDAKSWLIVKDPNTGKDRGQEEKTATENEMVGWRHWI